MKPYHKRTVGVTDLAILLLGAMLTLSFSPYEIFPFAIFAPAGLFIVWLKSSPSRAFCLGFLFGLSFFGTGVYWVFHSIHTFGGVPTVLAIFITAIFIAILALFPGIAGSLVNRYFPRTTNIKIMFAYPASWVLSEWIRSWIFTGFPWLIIGYSQTNSPLAGYAPIFGVFGVSLATLISSSLIVSAIIQLKKNNFRSCYLHLLTVVMIWTIGGLLSLIPWTKSNGHPITVSLVQGNIPQSIKWSPDHLQLSVDRYTNLSEPAWGKQNIIIWPEAAIPMSLQDATPLIEAMDNKAQSTGSTLILGIPIQSEDGSGYYNGIITLGTSKQVYLKRRLVPFGEFTPSIPFVSQFFDFMSIPMSNLIPGKSHQLPLDIKHIKILPSICYEIAFPELINTGDSNIGILLTITNDAWFGQSSAEAQHLQMGSMRAIELRRPLIFVSNDGMTAIIDPYGRIESAAPQYQAYVLNGSVQPMIGKTPWMIFKMDPILIILIGLLILVALSTKKEYKQSEKDDNARTI